MLLACAVNVYATPSIRPDTVMGLDVPVAVAPPGLTVTTTDATPPEESKATDAVVSPGVTAVIVGASGGLSGAADAGGTQSSPAATVAAVVSVKSRRARRSRTLRVTGATVATVPSATQNARDHRGTGPR